VVERVATRPDRFQVIGSWFPGYASLKSSPGPDIILTIASPPVVTLVSTCRHIFADSFPREEVPENSKWAASQEAVTFPWLSAHSIRTGIGGDAYIVFPPPRLSRINFHPNIVSI